MSPMSVFEPSLGA